MSRGSEPFSPFCLKPRPPPDPALGCGGEGVHSGSSLNICVMILHVAVSSAILSSVTHVNDAACFLLESETLLWLLERSETTYLCFLVCSYMDFIAKLTVNLFLAAVKSVCHWHS